METRRIALKTETTVEHLEHTLRYDDAAQAELLGRWARNLDPSIVAHWVRRGEVDPAVIAKWMRNLANHLDETA